MRALLPIAMAPNLIQLQLSDALMPSLAYGSGTTWFKRDPSNVRLNLKLVDAVKQALNVGFRHLDNAEVYGTEAEVGIAIKESGIPREQLFITTKVFPKIGNIEQALSDSLNALQISYVDLYLIHCPFFSKESHGVTLTEAWSNMEKEYHKGRARAIGVSNFRLADLQEILKHGKVKPVLNQIEYHPYLQETELTSFCKQHEILIEAYSPLASILHKPGGPVDSIVEEIASRKNITPGQVLIQWSLHKGHAVVTTSTKNERMAELFASADVELSEEEVESIDKAGSLLSFRKFWLDNLNK